MAFLFDMLGFDGLGFAAVDFEIFGLEALGFELLSLETLGLGMLSILTAKLPICRRSGTGSPAKLCGEASQFYSAKRTFYSILSIGEIVRAFDRGTAAHFRPYS